MPHKNRYVIAALDTDGEAVAYYSASNQWQEGHHDAMCFCSQRSAGHYLKTNPIKDSPGEVRAVLVALADGVHRVDVDGAPDDVAHAGIFG